MGIYGYVQVKSSLAGLLNIHLAVINLKLAWEVLLDSLLLLCHVSQKQKFVVIEAVWSIWKVCKFAMLSKCIEK